jgi:hypothetical protein
MAVRGVAGCEHGVFLPALSVPVLALLENAYASSSPVRRALAFLSGCRRRAGLLRAHAIPPAAFMLEGG